ncbi:hypothetical protein [Nitrospirillum viridazoti]|uniref:Uncharacterized protein n=1 Tax=Nitrospirillum viridazoti CBAmc TaxID=1441467 RepID=A0A248JXF1_9PROT|nr:hypothetical protein [Nitrospirillum amazonense]ASG23259.1 hypothetical protein Y958_20745 [Nitrospirillum amazonense CBAmc]TWB40082.1 hypothetical protein FBZ91_105318 [Nitrospirillum amazonense]
MSSASSAPPVPIAAAPPARGLAMPPLAAQIPTLARHLAHAALSVRLASRRLDQGHGQEARDELLETAAPALEQALEGIGRLEATLEAHGQVREVDLRPAATLRVRMEAATSLLKQADVLARAGLAEEAGDSREAALWTLERGLALVPPFSPAPSPAADIPIRALPPRYPATPAIGMAPP